MLHIILHTAKYSLNTYMCDISVKHKMHLWVTYIFCFTWLVHESQQVLLFTPLLVTHKPHYT